MSLSAARRRLLLPKRCVLFNKNYCSCKSLGLWREEFNDRLRHKIEEHWRPKLKKYCYNANDNRPKFYILSMFPYPSGNLHMGHVRVYTISDTIARYHRMLGKNVFQPMGWDAFGLPAENAAIERGESPEKWTYQNIKTMKAQLKALECCFDWDSELATCHPGYYKFTQYIFLKLFEKGLVYQKQAVVNWDPVDETVLADEQVDDQGRSWRSGAKVEKRPLRQWFIRTTQFAKSLNDGLDDPSLEDWRDITKLQKNWIGECNGWSFDFQLDGMPDTVLTVWTTRPEHIAKAKFIILAAGSLLAGETTNGMLDCKAISPVTGDRLPIYVTDGVSSTCGETSEATLGIPDAFEEHRLFASGVGVNVNGDSDECIQFLQDDETERKRVCQEAIANGYGGYMTSSRLKDWLISRQRYWGTPIPIVHCAKCGTQPVDYQDLPITLPPTHHTTSGGKSNKLTLQLATNWIKTKCPKCKGDAERETDTMDTFVDSSWYYLRYLDPRNEREPFNKTLADRLYPVDIYVGGKEHATLHLYYARFMAHFLHSIGWTAAKEPFRRLLVQGMVMGKTYRVKGTGRYLTQAQTLRKDKKSVVEKETGRPVVEQWEKMSKSKLNGVEPADMLAKYGIDTTRLLILADVSPTSNRHWNEQTFPGVIKWQHRLWLTVKEFIEARLNETKKRSETYRQQEEYVWDSRNYYLKGINFNYNTTYMLSTAISKMQGLTGSLRKSSVDVVALSGEYERALVLLAVVLAPIAPHFAAELWAGIQEATNRIDKFPGEIKWGVPIEQHPWPQVDSHYTLDLNLLINGVVRSVVKVPRQTLDVLTEEEAVRLAYGDDTIGHVLINNKVKSTLYKLYPGYQANINFFVDLSIMDIEKLFQENEKIKHHS